MLISCKAGVQLSNSLYPGNSKQLFYSNLYNCAKMCVCLVITSKQKVPLSSFEFSRDWDWVEMDIRNLKL